MKIAVFGSTGNTGLQLVSQILERGDECTALVRNPAKLAQHESNKNLKIVKCDILNSEEVASHIAGHDCVLSTLGVAGIALFKITFYQDSIKAIIEAMRKANLKRLICLTSFYSKPDNIYPMMYKMVMRPMLGRHLDSMNEMEEYLFNQCSDIDYTIVRPPRLLDAAISDSEVKVNENAYFFPDYSTKSQIPRANVAKFMLEALDKNLYVKQGVAIDLVK
ncbi:flavin reductase (NADPH)-like [Brachionus plicatilis]|uniref:Flavin reductase (NADPH)-like n=1 Tax=Brachionus plicatilis TaxID=10195 RepID=A0A3M7PLJ8_BRAPC|nr:flavin reductase (NADPH)-like [Brachionus plicatilis]